MISKSILKNITQRLIFLQMGIQCVKWNLCILILKGEHINGLEGQLSAKSWPTVFKALDVSCISPTLAKRS